MDGVDRPGRVALNAGVAVGFLAIVAAACWLARDVLLLAFFGVVLAVALSIPVRLLVRWMPRWLAILLVLATLGGAIGGGAALAVPMLSEQVAQVRQEAPKAIGKVRGWIDRVTASTAPSPSQGAPTPAPAPSGGGDSQVAQQALPALLAVGEGLTSVVLVAVLAVFLVGAPRTYQQGLRHLVPARWQPVFDESWERVGDGLRGWLRGIVVSMTVMGTMAAIGLWIIGIQQWFLLGVLTFFCTFVPYLGALVSALPGLLIALSQDTRHFLLALVVYTAVHVTEGYFVAPLVMKRAVKVQPALLLFGQGVLTAVFGLMGTIVATPLLVCLQALVGYLWVERHLHRPASPEEAAA